MPKWLEVAQVYTIVRLYIEIAISLLFELVNDLASDFSMFITAAATIYIALTGYALMSGWVSMSMREAVIRLSKVLGIILLLEIFRNFGLGLYEAVWDIPDGIGSFIARKFNPLVSSAGISILGVSVADNFDALMNIYATAATEVSASISGQNNTGGEKVSFGLISWFILMAPMFLTTIAVFLAKFISAVLFLIAPIVFGLSLIGYSNNYLTTWVKSLLVTFLTVIIVYIVGTAGLTLILVEMIRLELVSISPTFAWDIAAVAPVMLLAFFTIMLVSQAPTIASAIIGAAAVNTQQATSLLQIGALQSAR